MRKVVELPLLEPMCSTYHNSVGSALITENPSIRNWYLNEVMILSCERKFLSGYTSPNLNIVNMNIEANPHLNLTWLPFRFFGGQTNAVIRNLIDLGYYIFFWDIDDYYIEGKSFYHKRHFYHDGIICGYNQEDKTFCLYAYDKNWVFRKFWTTQKGFNAGRLSMVRTGRDGYIVLIKPKTDCINFSCEKSLEKIKEYLDSDVQKYPIDGEENVYGIVVHEYLARYIEKLYDGSIPYERMDWRIMRMIWEHKNMMLERIRLIEQKLNIGDEISKEYKTLVNEANNIRMLYAAHHVKRKDSVLPIIQNKLLKIMKTEQALLTLLVEKSKGVIKNETMAVS